MHKIKGWEITFFDVKSDKSPQMGCCIKFPDSKKLAFLGDEPLREHYIDIVKNCDVLIHNAFCLDSQQDIFKPHEKNHSTVKEATINATKIKAKNLFSIWEIKHLKRGKKNTLRKRKRIFPEMSLFLLIWTPTHFEYSLCSTILLNDKFADHLWPNIIPLRIFFR